VPTPKSLPAFSAKEAREVAQNFGTLSSPGNVSAD
jgi:hypothetical protein